MHLIWPWEYGITEKELAECQRFNLRNKNFWLTCDHSCYVSGYFCFRKITPLVLFVSFLICFRSDFDNGVCYFTISQIKTIKPAKFVVSIIEFQCHSESPNVNLHALHI